MHVASVISDFRVVPVFHKNAPITHVQYAIMLTIEC